MGVSTVIPVKEALSIDLIAYLECLNCLINVGIFAAEIRLNGKGVGVSSVGNVEVKVIALASRAVPLVKECNVIAVSILACNHGKTLECCKNVHLLCKLCLVAEYCSYVGCLCDIGVCALNEGKGSVKYLNLTCVFALVSADSDLCSGNELSSILFRTCHIVYKVCSVSVLKVCNDLVVPPRLCCLYVCLDQYRFIHLCCYEVSIRHSGVGNLLIRFALGRAFSCTLGRAFSRALGRTFSRALGRTLGCFFLRRVTSHEGYHKNKSQKQY